MSPLVRLNLTDNEYERLKLAAHDQFMPLGKYLLNAVDHGTTVLSDIADWQTTRFPDATIGGALAHLEAEIDEARAETDPRAQAEELADVIFMALQGIRVLGQDPAGLLKRKLSKNRRRAWPSKPDADGVYEHLEGE